TMTDNFMVRDPEYPTDMPSASLYKAKFAFQWAQDLESPEGTFTDIFFKMLYKNILTANTCIESLDIMEGTDKEKEVLKGQAHFTRAYGYFVLANTYAKPYNEASADDLCVPLITSTTPSLKSYPRNTIKEVWDLITDDIEIAVDALSKDEGHRSVYELNYKAALILASRIFLFKEEFDKVIYYGERYLGISPELKNITAVTTSPSGTGANAIKTFLYPFENNEIAWTFSKMTGAAQEGTYWFFTSDKTIFSPICMGASANIDDALINIYEANDRRKNHWFVPPTGVPGGLLVSITYSPTKVSYYDNIRFSQNMRTAEVYLNLAEAYARSSTPNNNGAIELLNTLRANRIASYTPITAANFTSTNSLLDFIIEERRRELCFEEFHRWWDLRRYGMPSITHDWLGEVYVLAEKDPAYILNFPKEELDFNKLLEPNIRPVRSKIN
ncbi:MAG: RagB/SusD family nutrient uptake outer membrane protein, partial [Bacteroidales bacterium]